MKKTKIFLSFLASLIIITLAMKFIFPQPSAMPVSHVTFKMVFSQSPDKTLGLKSMKLEEGYFSDYQSKLTDNYYTILIYGKEKETLFKGWFNSAITYAPPDPEPGGKALGLPFTKQLDEILLFLPYFKSMRSLRFFDEQENLKLEVAINKDTLPPVRINRNLCGNGICDFNENFLSCFSDCHL